MEIFDTILEFINSYWTTILVVGGVIVEIFVRLFTSDKVRSVLRIVAGVATGIGSIFTKVAELIDNVIPDRTPDA